MSEEDSLKRRYAFKLVANTIGMALLSVTQAIVPRALGPTSCGNFSFISNFFNQVFGIVDSGVSIGFYNKLSQRFHETALVRYNWFFVSVMNLSILLFTVFICLTPWQMVLLPDQTAKNILLIFLLTIFIKLLQTAGQIIDAYGLTAPGEVAKVGQRFLGCLLIALLFYMNMLNLISFILCQYVMCATLFFWWYKIAERSNIHFFPKRGLSIPVIKRYTKELFDYSSPIFVLGLATGFVSIFERWLLQKFSGSVEQGYFGFSAQVGSLCFLFSASMMPLLSREFSKAFALKDFSRMRSLFTKFIPSLYFVAAYFGVFMAVEAEKVGRLLGGEKFEGASGSIAFMAFYPLFQTYGQLSGSVFFAMGETRLFRQIGLSLLALDLLAAAWLIGPKAWGGLSLGALGLSIKTLGIAIISVNIQLLYNARRLDLPLAKIMAHELITVAMLVGIVWPVSQIVNRIVPSLPLSLFLSAFFYTAACVMILAIFPSLLFMSRSELKRRIVEAGEFIGQSLKGKKLNNAGI